MPASFTGASTVAPATMTEPRRGNCNPVASFITVDLPQPDGPTMATNSPSPTVRLRSSTAGAPSSAPG